LNIVEGFDLAGMAHLSADSVHHMVEAKKLAFEDRARFAGDAAFVDFAPASMLSKEWAAERRRAIDPQRARADTAVAASSDTTSFVVADGDGNVCSFIQSIFAHFGSAVAIDGTGIIMNNRMRGFSLDPASPNVLAPGKHTMHTLNTYLVFRDGDGDGGRVPYIVGNTPGADYQVQTNLQVLTGIIDYGLDPQAAVDAPRWGDTGGELQIERGIPAETAAELARRGHRVREIARETSPTGRAQCIVIDPVSGAMIGGSDTRGEGAAAGW
jgi:gamma-glutamyltranspeptidase/glutathione hydrolase